MILKSLFYIFATYYLYRHVIKPMLPNMEQQKGEEPQANIRFKNKEEPQGQVDENDYIDYEEVD